MFCFKEKETGPNAFQDTEKLEIEIRMNVNQTQNVLEDTTSHCSEKPSGPCFSITSTMLIGFGLQLPRDPGQEMHIYN